MVSRDRFIPIRRFARYNIANGSLILDVNEESVKEVLIPRIEKHLEDRKTEKVNAPGEHLSWEQEQALILFFNAINFCYTNPAGDQEYKVTINGKVVKRSTGLQTAMAVSGVDWNNAKEVSSIDRIKWQEMSQMDRETNPLYLGFHRGGRLVNFARIMLLWGHTTADSFLNQSDYNAATLVERLIDSTLFEDPKFLKRAQLTVSMLNDARLRRGMDKIPGMEKLTVMADYRIPQVFYNLGVVELDMTLKQRLSMRRIISPNSAEEDTLRSTAVYIGQQVARLMGVTEAEVDGYLWDLSQVMVRSGEMKIPHMLVPTDAY